MYSEGVAFFNQISLIQPLHSPHRFFCTGEIVLNNTESFPVSGEVLDQLSLDLAGEGYDAMIRALYRERPYTDGQDSTSVTVH